MFLAFLVIQNDFISYRSLRYERKKGTLKKPISILKIVRKYLKNLESAMLESAMAARKQ